jgi:magnesium transporter
MWLRKQLYVMQCQSSTSREGQIDIILCCMKRPSNGKVFLYCPVKEVVAWTPVLMEAETTYELIQNIRLKKEPEFLSQKGVIYMNGVTVLGEFYFSRLLGKPIYDASGARIGRIKDMTARWESASPQVVGIKYAKKVHDLIPVAMVERCTEQGVYLSKAFSGSKLAPLLNDDIYISKWLLDKQIIDLKGSRLVRVNDITLSWIAQEHRRRMVLVAVDIGVRGLFRRLGLEFLVKRWENQLLGLQHIKPLEKRTSALQLIREKEQLGQLHPADIADILEDMDYKRRADFIKDLDAQQAVEALAEMDLDSQVEIIEQMDARHASDLLEEMSPDDAADILVELPAKQSEDLLNLMESEDAQDVRELMQYEDDTAGALMTTEYIGFAETLTAEQAIDQLRELAPAAETIYYLYVVNDSERLLGVLSLRELIIAPPNAKLCDFMQTKLVTVETDDSHQKVADVMNKYGLLAVPVLDEHGVMQGIITVDDVLDILLPEKEDTHFWFTLSKRVGRGM